MSAECPHKVGDKVAVERRDLVHGSIIFGPLMVERVKQRPKVVVVKSAREIPWHEALPWTDALAARVAFERARMALINACERLSHRSVRGNATVEELSSATLTIMGLTK